MGYVARVSDIVKSRSHSYTILKEINKGGFADAYKASTDDGTIVFLKQYKSPSKLVPWFKDYVEYVKELNKRLSNDPILKSATIYANEVFLGKTYQSDGRTPWSRNDCLFQAFPFVSGNTTLEELILKDFNEYDWEKRIYACTVFAFALRKLHDADIIHCDLKPENVQIKYDPTIAIKYKPLLIDMDWSLLSDKTAPWNGQQGYVGTVGYNSPEHLRGEIPLEASDVFTAAIIICQVLAARHPFGSHLGKDDFTEYVLSGANDFTKKGKIPFKDYVTPKFHDLVMNALNVDASKRPTMQDIHMELMSMCKSHGKPDHSQDPNYSIVNNLKKVGAFFFGKKNEAPIEDPIMATKTTDVSMAKEEPVTNALKFMRKTLPKITINPKKHVDIEPMKPLKIKKHIAEAEVSNITLIGDIGKSVFKTSFSLDMNTLKRISSHAKYADATCQFKIINSTGNWIIEAGKNTANATAVNSKVVADGSSIELHEGDEISLKGRSSGKSAMPVMVHIG